MGWEKVVLLFEWHLVEVFGGLHFHGPLGFGFSVNDLSTSDSASTKWPQFSWSNTHMSDEWRRNQTQLWTLDSRSFWLERMEMWSASRMFPVLQCFRWCTRHVWYQKCRRHMWEGMDRASRLVYRFANISEIMLWVFEIRRLILGSQSWCHSQSLVGQVNDFIWGILCHCLMSGSVSLLMKDISIWILPGGVLFPA